MWPDFWKETSPQCISDIDNWNINEWTSKNTGSCFSNYEVKIQNFWNQFHVLNYLSYYTYTKRILFRYDMHVIIVYAWYSKIIQPTIKHCISNTTNFGPCYLAVASSDSLLASNILLSTDLSDNTSISNAFFLGDQFFYFAWTCVGCIPCHEGWISGTKRSNWDERKTHICNIDMWYKPCFLLRHFNQSIDLKFKTGEIIISEIKINLWRLKYVYSPVKQII